jgi:hypothetical protein
VASRAGRRGCRIGSIRLHGADGSLVRRPSDDRRGDSRRTAICAGGFLLESWIKEREARQLDRISTVAYRSLAQYANDAGRSLLAPLNGADLYALGIPGASASSVAAAAARLEKHGLEKNFDEATGSWGNIDRLELDQRLRLFSEDRDFVGEMFRTTALQRRRLQEATALWAPVMLMSRATTRDLSQFRNLTDALEMLQERWRIRGWGAQISGPPNEGWLDDVSKDFWAAGNAYEELRDEFAALAKLPSDAIIRRRAPRSRLHNDTVGSDAVFVGALAQGLSARQEQEEG